VSREPELAGQTVVVIGGSSGIQLETARRARSEGADIVLTARNPERLEHAARELGALSRAAFDATDFERLERFETKGLGMVAAGGPMARLPELIGRNRALEVLLSSEDIRADRAGVYGYANRALPDVELDAFVEALATRIAGFDKWAIANTKRLVNTSLPPDVELEAGWDACIASVGRPAAQNGIKR
jgi:NAD(P)-dependent dehydrogenase (short-subunit alcohol dehydrogenase family)